MLGSAHGPRAKPLPASHEVGPKRWTQCTRWRPTQPHTAQVHSKWGTKKQMFPDPQKSSRGAGSIGPLTPKKRSSARSVSSQNRCTHWEGGTRRDFASLLLLQLLFKVAMRFKRSDLERIPTKLHTLNHQDYLDLGPRWSSSDEFIAVDLQKTCPRKGIMGPLAATIGPQ